MGVLKGLVRKPEPAPEPVPKPVSRNDGSDGRKLVRWPSEKSISGKYILSFSIWQILYYIRWSFTVLSYWPDNAKT